MMNREKKKGLEEQTGLYFLKYVLYSRVIGPTQKFSSNMKK